MRVINLVDGAVMVDSHDIYCQVIFVKGTEKAELFFWKNEWDEFIDKLKKIDKWEGCGETIFIENVSPSDEDWGPIREPFTGFVALVSKFRNDDIKRTKTVLLRVVGDEKVLYIRVPENLLEKLKCGGDTK